MMDNIKAKITAILTDAEEKLQGLISDAAKRGDYDAVEDVNSIASQIRFLGTQNQPVSQVAANVTSPARATDNTGLTKPSGYPVFRIDGGVLIRTGWSKRQRQEYVQKVPRDAFDPIVGAISDVCREKNGLVLVEDIIKRIVSVSLGEIPSYQVYAVVGLLSKNGCIKKHGRRGYEIPSDIKMRAQKEWESLERSDAWSLHQPPVQRRLIDR